MVFIDKGIIKIGEKTEEIKKWEVWFIMPFGMTPSFDQAVETCRQLDFDPAFNIVPVPVAVGETLYEICGVSK